MIKLLTMLLALMLLGVASAGCDAQRRRPTTQKAAMTRDADAAEPKKAGDPADDDDDKTPRKTLHERIGGEATIVAVVDDLVARAAADPKVNFTRNGTTRPWQATPENVARLKTRLIQFLGTATGGPQRYEGEDMRTAHRGMRISRGEFAAFAKHVQASLAQVGVKEKERKELMEIIESTRGTIVEQPATRRR